MNILYITLSVFNTVCIILSPYNALFVLYTLYSVLSKGCEESLPFQKLLFWNIGVILLFAV